MFMPTACGIFVKLFEIGKTADQTRSHFSFTT